MAEEKVLTKEQEELDFYKARICTFLDSLNLRRVRNVYWFAKTFVDKGGK